MRQSLPSVADEIYTMLEDRSQHGTKHESEKRGPSQQGEKMSEEKEEAQFKRQTRHESAKSKSTSPEHTKA